MADRFKKELLSLNTESHLHLDHNLIPGQSGALVANSNDGKVFGIAGQRRDRTLDLGQPMRQVRGADSILNWTVATSTMNILSDMKLKLSSADPAGQKAIKTILEQQDF